MRQTLRRTENEMSRTATIALATVDATEETKPTRVKHTGVNPYHLWANEAYAYLAEIGGDYAANVSGGNMSFTGKRAYSYATEIGLIVTNAKGEKAFLLNTTSYSNTTAGHQSALRSAIPGHRWDGKEWSDTARIFRVHGLSRGDVLTRIVRSPKVYTDGLIRLAASAVADSKRPRIRQTTRDAYLAKGAQYLEEARELAAFFGIKNAGIPKNVDSAAQAIERERKRQAVADKKAVKEREKADALKRVEDADRFAQWLAGAPVRFPYSYARYDYLRLNPSNPSEVQTSRGAYVPTDHVRRLAPKLLWMIRNGKTYPFTGLEGTTRLGHYTLNSVDKDGVVTVGCHRFERAEIERFAAVLDEHDATAEKLTNYEPIDLGGNSSEVSA